MLGIGGYSFFHDLAVSAASDTDILWGRTSLQSLQQVTQHEKLCETVTFKLGRAGTSDSPRFRYQRLSSGTGTWPLDLPFKEDIVNRVMVPGITLPWSKTTFLVKLLLLLCFPTPALLWLAKVALQMKCRREHASVIVCTRY